MGKVSLRRASKTTGAIGEAARHGWNGIRPLETRGGVFAIRYGLNVVGFTRCRWRTRTSTLVFLRLRRWVRCWTGVGWKEDVVLRGFAGEDVEGRVDGDFKMSTLAGVTLIHFGQTQDNLGGGEAYGQHCRITSGPGWQSGLRAARHTLIQ